MSDNLIKAGDIGQSNRGRVRTPEDRASKSRALIGRKNGPLSAEHRAKISASMRGKVS